MTFTVSMARFLNARSLNKWWERLIVYFGTSFSANLMFFQSRTIGHSGLLNVLRIFYACEKNFKFMPPFNLKLSRAQTEPC
jgi:hypothetical protein